MQLRWLFLYNYLYAVGRWRIRRLSRMNQPIAINTVLFPAQYRAIVHALNLWMEMCREVHNRQNRTCPLIRLRKPMVESANTRTIHVITYVGSPHTQFMRWKRVRFSFPRSGPSPNLPWWNTNLNDTHWGEIWHESPTLLVVRAARLLTCSPSHHRGTCIGTNFGRKLKELQSVFENTN